MYTRVLASATRSVLSLHLRCDTRCAVNVNWFGSKCSPGLSASSRALQPSAAYRQVVHGGASRALCVRALSRSLEPYDPFIEPQIPKWNESVGWKYALTVRQLGVIMLGLGFTYVFIGAGLGARPGSGAHAPSLSAPCLLPAYIAESHEQLQRTC